MHTRTKLIAPVGALAALVLLAGCTGGGTSTGEPDASGVTYRDGDGNCAAEPADGVDLAAAEEIIDLYSQPVEELLVDEPLAEPIAEGTTVAFLNNDTTIGSLMYDLMVLPAETAGVELINVSTGTDAQSINTALNSVVEIAPDIVIAPALDATFWQDQLAALQANGTAIVYTDINAADFGLDDTLGGYNTTLINGRVHAAAAVAFTCGTGKDIVLYTVPELGFSSVQAPAIEEALAEFCPDCALRTVDISITDASPADKIVSDLQANPDTDFFLTLVDQNQVGLAEKAGLAGIDNAVGFGQNSLPTNLQQIADGTQIAGMPVDLSAYMWILLDEGLRKMQGTYEPITDWESAGRANARIITQSTAAEFVEGFSSFPDIATEYARVWGVDG